jgi:hypothetical protein
MVVRVVSHHHAHHHEEKKTQVVPAKKRIRYDIVTFVIRPYIVQVKCDDSEYNEKPLFGGRYYNRVHY